ncbi:MAG TPA: hypothetical protein VM536_16520 [Chloroflexia bacterium]|nr:hypothetical protein [Chloroflexia bacterium]
MLKRHRRVWSFAAGLAGEGTGHWLVRHNHALLYAMPGGRDALVAGWPAAGAYAIITPMNRLAPYAPRVVAGVLGLLLLAALADLPARWSLVADAWPMLQLWGTPTAQYRLTTAPAPYDLLQAADALLPPDAAVLLVTPGTSVDYVEYNTYHRALYFLTPRPVWWMAPAPRDDTWKARWWISAPLTPESVRAVATLHQTTYVLAVDLPAPLALGRPHIPLPGGELIALAGAAPAGLPVPAPLAAGPLWPLQIALAVATLFGPGGLTVWAIRRAGYPVRGLEAAGLAALLGAGLTSVLVFWLTAVGVPWAAQAAQLSALAAGVAVPWTRAALRRHATPEQSRPQAGPRRRPPGPRALLAGGLLALLAFQLLLAAAGALGRPLTIWDSWANWSVKARILFDTGAITPALYADPSRTVTQLDYPLLVPFLEAWVYHWLGVPDDRFAGIVMLLFYLGLVALSFGLLRHWGANYLLAVAATTAVGTLSFIPGLTIAVFAELPVIVFSTVTGLYLLAWLRGGPPGALLIAALAAGLLLWTKREGLLVLLALALAMLLTPAPRRALTAIGALGAAAAVLAGPWWALMAATHTVNAAFLPITPATFLANAWRWSTIVRITARALWSPASGYVWPLVLVGGLLTWWAVPPERRGVGAFIPLAAGLYLLMTGAIYLFSGFVPFEQHILASVDRLIAGMAPLAVIWLVARLLPGVAPAGGVARAPAARA